MRDLTWMGSSLEDLSAFPVEVKRAFGFALREVYPALTLALHLACQIARAFHTLRLSDFN